MRTNKITMNFHLHLHSNSKHFTVHLFCRIYNFQRICNTVPILLLFHVALQFQPNIYCMNHKKVLLGFNILLIFNVTSLLPAPFHSSLHSLSTSKLHKYTFFLKSFTFRSETPLLIFIETELPCQVKGNCQGQKHIFLI